jgi:Acetyltransferases, including N-acetylases of ribosomal proteins
MMTDTLQIRPIQVDDAAAFLELCKQLDRESSLMMLEPDERTSSLEEVQERIASVLACSNSTILVIDTGAGLCGYIEAEGGSFRRNRHSAILVVGIVQAYAGRGLGRKLFEAIEEWGRQNGIHRLELTVQAHNERAVHLYRRCGFEIEGTRRHSLLVDGFYVDEYALAKLI